MEKLEKKLLSGMAKASADFRLLEPGDRVMVAVSGGKDSYGMLYLLRELQKKRPIYACEISGVRHDTGNKLGFLKALVYFALKRPDLAEPFRQYLESLDLKVPAPR